MSSSVIASIFAQSTVAKALFKDLSETFFMVAISPPSLCVLDRLNRIGGIDPPMLALIILNHACEEVEPVARGSAGSG